MLQASKKFISPAAYAQAFFILIFCKEAEVAGLNV
jgi:hypothetical protein